MNWTIFFVVLVLVVILIAIALFFLFVRAVDAEGGLFANKFPMDKGDKSLKFKYIEEIGIVREKRDKRNDKFNF